LSISNLFISYTGRDPEGEAWTNRLEEWCGEWGYGFFRDKHPGQGVKAGDDWRHSLNRHLSCAQVVISLCSPSYQLSSWCMWELAAAEVRGKWIIPIQFGKQEVPSLLGHRQVIRVANARQPTASQLAEVKERLAGVLRVQLDWRMLQPWDPSRSPYPGLLAFEAEQAPVFFGQDKAIEKLGERLASLALRAPAALLVLGASGTGKSSLVRAGVLPRLAADRDRWQLLAPFRPGRMPFTRLRKALAPALAAFPETPPEPAHEADEIEVARQLDWLQAHAERPVLLVIDQLEELLVEGNPEAERFLAFLEGQLRRELGGLVVLATLRTDFLAVLESRWPGLTDLVETTTPEPIPPQRFGELISGPAARADLRLQPGLAERLVAESGGRDALPLLAFTLEKLWRKRQERGGPVMEPSGARWDRTMADYEDLKGMDGVVGTQAELCWDPRTSDAADSEALEQAFVHRLVRLNEEGLATKQPARWGELPERSRPLLQRFVEARLLVRGSGDGGDQVEIAHEALLRTWEPLVGWIVANRKELEQRRRVARLCGDLATGQPPQARLAALQGLLALAETDPEAVAPAAEALGAVLTNPDADPREGPLAIQLLELVCGESGVACLSAFLEQRQILELQDTALAAPRLKQLCQAASLLQRIHRHSPPAAAGTDRWLLLPSATVCDDGRAVRTELVRLRLWATPRLETPGAWLEPLGEDVALTMVTIPPGRFVMGSPPHEVERRDLEGPQHLVELEGFWMGQTPISQAQWRQVMGTNPSEFQGDRTDRDQRPVEGVRWEESMAFCAKLRERTGRHYSLPSEAQWEYACRAGTTTPFHCGATLISELANFNATSTYGAAAEGDAREQTSAVDQFPANRWGLLDLHGNVSEWCLDEWHISYDGAPKDGRAWLGRQGSSRREPDGRTGVSPLRGGSWYNRPRNCRSAYRSNGHPGFRNFDIGFRVCCLPQD
jgi:formylglycine-generating enzyme required for sulfatase activity